MKKNTVKDHKDLEEYLGQFRLAPPAEHLYRRLAVPAPSVEAAAPWWTWRGWGFEAILTAALTVAVLVFITLVPRHEGPVDQPIDFSAKAGLSAKAIAVSLETTEDTARYLVAHLDRSRRMLEREAVDRWRQMRGGSS